MLVQSSPPLAQRVAGIAAAMRATADEQAAGAGLLAALHALILTTLARLFGRLEHIVQLWQAGQLSLPAEPQPARRSPAPSRAKRTTASRPAAFRKRPRAALCPAAAPQVGVTPSSSYAAPDQSCRAPAVQSMAIFFKYGPGHNAHLRP